MMVPVQEAKNMNETMIQFFEWYLPADQTLWKQVSARAEELARTGFTMAWLPPAYKGQAGKDDVGYGVYDLYDLGEFGAKGSVPTKYGTKEEYLQCIRDLQSQGMKAIGDIVLNHRMGSDETEDIRAVNMNPENREQTAGDPYDVKVWTKFTFPERNGKYSDFQWTSADFTATDYNANNGQNDLLKFEGHDWSERVSHEQGNFDYIMGDDVDFSNPEVVEELFRWGKWYTETTGINGFRLDAVKSIDAQFFMDWLAKMKEYGNHPDFAVGEYWSGDTAVLEQYLKDSGHCMELFDVPLHFHLMQISQNPDGSDLRTVFQDTLTDLEPEFACAFSDNHDTQPGQALVSWVEDWFKPISYALLLLNRCKTPCVFYGDYYGIPHDGKNPVPFLAEMVWIRSHLLSEERVDYDDDDPKKAAWMTLGEHPIVVVASIAEGKQQEITDLSLKDQTLVCLQDASHKISADQDGKAVFDCPEKGVAVYLLESDFETLQKDLHPEEKA